MKHQCIGEPISWLKLEQYVLGELECKEVTEIEEHTKACPLCGACLAEVRAGVYEPLPPLPEVKPRVSWWTKLVSVFSGRRLAFAASFALLLALVPRVLPDVTSSTTDPAALGVKGSGVLAILVGERDGIVREAPVDYRVGDRFKWFVTCAPPQILQYDVVVVQDGRLYFPLESSSLSCQNRNPLPGAFSLTGNTPATVCLLTGDIERASLTSEGLKDGTADAECIVLTPGD